MSEIIYNSNKAMVAYLLKNNCRVLDVKLGYHDTILFGFNKAETNDMVKRWYEEHLNLPNKTTEVRES